jgi:ABC-type transport system involved in multi-copper enzyme maturation permease subunit
MLDVFLLSFQQLSGRWRLAIMTVLAALPVLVSVLVMRGTTAPSVAQYEIVVLSGLLAGSILPLVVLAIAASAFANELDDRTLANLTLTPLPRWQIAIPKLLASIALATPFIATSAILTAHIAFLGDLRATLAVTLGAMAGVGLYAAVFTWLGLYTTQAIGVGLLYIVVWEGFFAGFVSGARLLSIRHYALGVMHAVDARRLAEADLLPPVAAVTVTVVVIALFAWLSVRRLRRMDVP